jgi:hypothetical protein
VNPLLRSIPPHNYEILMYMATYSQSVHLSVELSRVLQTNITEGRGFFKSRAIGNHRSRFVEGV